MTDTKFVFYDEELWTIKERLGIKSYSNGIIGGSAIGFLHTEHKASIDYLLAFANYAKIIAYGVIAVVRFFCSTDVIKDLAQGGSDLTNAGIRTKYFSNTSKYCRIN